MLAMERRKVAKKMSDMFILDCFILLLSATLVSAIEAEENSGSGRPVWNIHHSTEDLFSWSESSIEVNVGLNLTFSCLVDAFDLQYDVFRISLLQGDVLFPLVENGLVHAPFSDIPRYSVAMIEDRGNGGARMTIRVHDIQPEDAGTYICSKYLEGDNSATVNVTVLAPISDLFITSIDPDGEEMRMDADSEVFLQEHDFYGVGCIATVDGQIPPDVRIEIDGKDETESFQAIHEVDASVLPSGLTLWTSHLRLASVSATPNPDYNEKLMRCVASQTGFTEVETTTRLLVQFAPLISCVPERLLARQGTSATLDCSIRANPGSRITWSSARGDLSNYPNVFFDETVLGSDETRLRLSIRDIRPINFQRYTLTAANIIASSQSTFELVEDETVAVETHPEVESFQPDEDGLLPPEMVEEVFPNGDDFPAMDSNWFLERTSFVREPSSTLVEASSTSTEAISTAPEASITIPDSSSSYPEEDRRTVAADIITSSDVHSSLLVVRSALQNDDSIFLGTTLSDVESTFQNVESALQDVTSTLPTVKGTLSTVNSALPTVKGALPTVIDTSPTVIGTLPTVIDTSTTAIDTSPTVKSTLSTIKSTLPTVKGTLPAVKNTLPTVKSTVPTVNNISPDATNIIQSVDSTPPFSISTSLEVKRTLAPVKTPSKGKKSTTIEFNLADPTIAMPSAKNLPPSGKPHSSAGGRARSANHKGTSIPLKTSKDAALPVTTAAVPMMAAEPNVAASSKEDEEEEEEEEDEEEEELEQPLPAAAGEVLYSLSRSSSSSSSKKDSGKSGEASKSTSGAAAITVLQYLLASLLLIRWF